MHLLQCALIEAYYPVTRTSNSGVPGVARDKGQSSNSAKSLTGTNPTPLPGFGSRISFFVSDVSIYADFLKSVPYICFGPNLFCFLENHNQTL